MHVHRVGGRCSCCHTFKVSFIVDVAIQTIQAQVANLMNELIVLTAKEALGREIWILERKEILTKIEGINEMVGTKDTFGNGMAAVTLTKQYGWKLAQPNRERGQYFGLVVALEFHAAIVKISKTDILELPFGSLAVTEECSPRIGDSVHMSFLNGVLTATVTGRDSIDRKKWF